jgi:hypothetical protein
LLMSTVFLMMMTETGLRAPPDPLHQNNETLHA